MALRTIRVQGDPVLEKICKPVKELTPRTKELIEDMLDTMYEANGVGLAAPQVGILKRIVVIDVGEGPVVMVNPVILETSGEQTGDEGCLSIPGKAGQVTRPNYVKVHAFDENMEEYEIEDEEHFGYWCRPVGAVIRKEAKEKEDAAEIDRGRKIYERSDPASEEGLED